LTGCALSALCGRFINAFMTCPQVPRCETSGGRANLLTAARDIGSVDALRRLGNSQQSAAEYPSAS
jgi:hypothetical protein